MSDLICCTYTTSGQVRLLGEKTFVFKHLSLLICQTDDMQRFGCGIPALKELGGLVPTDFSESSLFQISLKYVCTTNTQRFVNQ